MKFFKNITGNGIRVVKGTAGALASDFVANKVMTKIPKIGEKPILTNLATAMVGIVAMDYKMLEDFAFGAAINQATNAAYTMPKIKEFTGISDANMSDDMVSEIEDNIQKEIELYKKGMTGSAAVVSDEPTYGIHEEFAY